MVFQKEKIRKGNQKILYVFMNRLLVLSAYCFTPFLWYKKKNQKKSRKNRNKYISNIFRTKTHCQLCYILNFFKKLHKFVIDIYSNVTQCLNSMKKVFDQVTGDKTAF